VRHLSGVCYRPRGRLSGPLDHPRSRVVRLWRGVDRGWSRAGGVAGSAVTRVSIDRGLRAAVCAVVRPGSAVGRWVRTARGP